MKTRLTLPAENFHFQRTVRSHGWSSLAPFHFDGCKLCVVFSIGPSVVAAEIKQKAEEIHAECRARQSFSRKTALEIIRRILDLDKDCESFYRHLEPDENWRWVREMSMGRIMRSATLFEDIVKTICTTNCSWSLTKLLVSRLVEKLGPAGPEGKKAFPSAERMAAQPVSFYRKEIRAGYRSEYLKEFAERAAAGEFDFAAIEDLSNSDENIIAELKKIRGIGPYAAGNLMRILGRHSEYGIDSWCRAKFRSLYGPRIRSADRHIKRKYDAHGKWRGLVMWLDLTRSWHEEKSRKLQPAEK